MKWLALPVVFALALSGCKGEDDDARYRARPKGSVPVALPVQPDLPTDPSTPMNLAKPTEARVRVELYGAREAVRLYRMEHGAPPPSLSALDLSLRFAADLTYDPATGAVKSKTYPQY